MITLRLLSTGRRDLREPAFKDSETRGEETASHKNIKYINIYQKLFTKENKSCIIEKTIQTIKT